jgi:lysophospholipid acyltransferase (LPLAT)-like uncharacterized protein
MTNVLTLWRSAGLRSYLEHVRSTSTIVLSGNFEDQQVLAIWHENMYLGLLACSSVKGLAVYAWKHRMAEFSVDLMRSLGLHVIEGSEDNLYGRKAVTNWLSGGSDRKLVVAVDGPLGPRRVVKKGALHFAATSGVPVRAVTFSAVGMHRLPTWDSRCVPEPGVRITMSNEREILPGKLDSTSDLQRALQNESTESSPQFTASALAGRCWVRACSGPYYFGHITWGSITPADG